MTFRLFLRAKVTPYETQPSLCSLDNVFPFLGNLNYQTQLNVCPIIGDGHTGPTPAMFLTDTLRARHSGGLFCMNGIIQPLPLVSLTLPKFRNVCNR
ncbi:hypothetical protein SAMN05421790_11230 [Kroppenstedtia eburnea]|uniref:Uncharacterized protein n=1 Tax=Kroppenstedtia eburnea TaxID=714067 RepID=A0A1N7PDK2_9BACL|nr:hypothetical protein SAMN05421790_11230 [Kroppenstedtia eburnea]